MSDTQPIYWENHHRIPRHAGGTDDPSNLVRLPHGFHIAFHYLRWLELGDPKDLIAVQTMLGQIDKLEATRLAGIAANLGNTHAKGSKSRTGQHSSPASSAKRWKTRRERGTDRYSPEIRARMSAARTPEVCARGWETRRRNAALKAAQAAA